MMQLPESLQPWAQWLVDIDPALWPALDLLLGRIAPLPGPLSGVHSGGTPQPVGVADVQRRGPYERLLGSEWLLADALPDEFIRRATSGEHLFLTPELRAHQAHRQMLVLFDAGPAQWGAPRLVHMALLIVLARRAQAAGGELLWGIVQVPGETFTLESSAQLKRLLKARTDSSPQAAHWQQWQAWLADRSEPMAECWAVGLRFAADAPWLSHRVRLQRPLQGDGVSFQLSGARNQQVLLPLPDSSASQRLLLGRFGTRPASTVNHSRWKVALSFPPIISLYGNQVALPLLDQPGAVVFGIPCTGAKKPSRGQQHRWQARFKPLAACFIGHRLAAAVSNASQLAFWQVPALEVTEVPLRGVLQVPIGTATLLPCAWLGSRPGKLYCLDRRNRLVYWSRDGASPTRLHPVARDVLGLGQVGQESLAFVRREGGLLTLSIRHSGGGATPAISLGAARDAQRVLFAGSSGRRRPFVPCAVYFGADPAGTWQVHEHGDDPAKARTFVLGHGGRALGLLHDPASGRASLVAMGADSTRFFLFDGQAQEPLFTTATPAAQHAFCPVSGVLAVLTRARELLVFSVHERVMRLQVMCTGAAEQEVSHD
ncbi:hypothetical protein [Pseudomonas putida]